MRRLPRRGDTLETTTSITARVLALFEALGLRNTQPRRVIAERLAALATSGADFTASDLWDGVRAVDPHVGRATVYRAVDVLVGQGALDRVSFADGTHRYRLCSATHHHHLTCTNCQCVVEVAQCLPPELLAAVAANTDFAIEGHSLELYGLCARCRDGPRG
ncbi:MAG: Fur family transcriptional regulator [Ktedonobacterales bacterium]